MAVFTGIERTQKDIDRVLSKSLKTEVRQYIFDELKQQLATNRQSDGTPRPNTPPVGQKKASTIKAYQKKGWDTQHYLVATGESTKLNAAISDGGKTLTITPERPEILSYHIPESQYRGKIDWMTLHDEDEIKIVEILNEALAREFS